MDSSYKYYAFISYSSNDMEWGKRVQRKLEHYRMPATLCSERGWKRTPIKPVFFAPTDIQPGELTEELQERLRASRNLIVICSPNSAQSEWVGKEIAFFHSEGRTRNIHFFIVDGVPHSGDPATECFNPVLETLDMPEILGANIHENIYRWPWLNRERAYVQLVSKLLGVEFDSIWQRHKRQLAHRCLLWVLAVSAMIAAIVLTWRTSQPVDVEMELQETPSDVGQLPPLHEAVFTLTLDNETKTDTLRAAGKSLIFANIPRRFVGRQVRLTVNSRDSLLQESFLPIDTMVELTPSLALPLRRNHDTYGHVVFQLWDGASMVPDVSVSIDGQQAVSDKNGRVELHVPIARQRTSYTVSASVPLADSIVYMPCTVGSLPTLLVEL